MAIEAERLLAIFEARFTSLEKALAKARGDANKAFGDVEAAGGRAENTLSRLGSRGTPSLDRMTRSAKALGGQLSALPTQFNQIGQQLIGGQSPLLVAIQQGSDITQALGPLGARGAVAALGGAFASLTNPVSLGTIAIIAGGGYVAQYFASLLSGGEKSAVELQKEAELIQKVAQEWGDAIPAVKAYVEQRQKALQEGNLVEAGKIAQQAAFTELLPYLDKFQVGIADLQTQIKDTNFQPIQQAFVNFMSKVKEGNATQKDLIDLQAAVRFAFINEGVKGADDFARSLSAIEPIFLKMADAAKKAGEEIRAALKRDELPVFDPRDPRFNNGILPQTAPIPDRLGPDDILAGSNHRTVDGFLRSRAASDRIADRIELLDKDFADRLSQLLVQFPNLKIASAFRTFEEQKRIYDSGVRPAAKPGNSLHEKGLAVDLSAGGGVPSNIQDIYAVAKSLGIVFPVKNDPLHAQPFSAQAMRGSTAKTPDDIFKGNMDQIQRRIDLINAEYEAQAKLNPLVKDYGYQVEYAKAKQDLLNDAQKAGIEVTPELAEKIDILAQNYAKAKAARDQLTQSQRLAASAAREGSEFGKDVLGGFIRDLRDGKDASDALADALGKVADKLLDAALNDAFGLQPGGNGTGGPLSFLGNIFSFLFRASGGPIHGPGGPKGDKIPTMLSDGEYVVNSDATRKNRALLDAINYGGLAYRAGGGAMSGPPASPIIRRSTSGSAGGDYLAVDGTFKVVNGNIIPVMTEVSGYVAGRQVKSANKALPGRLASQQARGV